MSIVIMILAVFIVRFIIFSSVLFIVTRLFIMIFILVIIFVTIIFVFVITISVRVRRWVFVIIFVLVTPCMILGVTALFVSTNLELVTDSPLLIKSLIVNLKSLKLFLLRQICIILIARTKTLKCYYSCNVACGAWGIRRG